ncbi:hypothetical protein ABFS83_06G159600 [Erythranthe nasuta]
MQLRKRRKKKKMMSLNPSTFETIVPSRYLTFSFPDPHHHRRRRHLRVAVLDSPSAVTSSDVAAVWVPPGRETDWIFSTFSGHLQLLLSSTTTNQPLSRLILVGKTPSQSHPSSYNSDLHHPSSSAPPQQNLAPLLLALSPKSAFLDNGEIPEIPFLIYEDDVVKSSILEICVGPCVGEMLVENVELEIDGVKEFRRRLRFKRMPNFVQSQIRIVPKSKSRFKNLPNFEDLDFELDTGVLVQSYLSPMVAGISVISQFLEGQMKNIGFRPKALCLGVGGGALVGFLNAQLDFEVFGVDNDEVVIEIGKKYFGLESNEFIHLFTDDAIKYVEKLAENTIEGDKFHAVMVDLDSSDPTVSVCAPPMGFVRKSVLEAIRDVMRDEGVLVINTIPSSKLDYERLICEFHGVFQELYEIDTGNGDNFVLIATKSKIENALEANEGPFFSKLKSVVSRSYIDSIRKISKNTIAL